MGTAGNVLHSTIVVPTVFIAVWLVMISQGKITSKYMLPFQYFTQPLHFFLAHGTFTCYDEHGATVLGPSTVPECCLKGGLSYSTAATLTFEMSNCLGKKLHGAAVRKTTNIVTILQQHIFCSAHCFALPHVFRHRIVVLLHVTHAVGRNAFFRALRTLFTKLARAISGG